MVVTAPGIVAGAPYQHRYPRRRGSESTPLCFRDHDHAFIQTTLLQRKLVDFSEHPMSHLSTSTLWVCGMTHIILASSPGENPFHQGKTTTFSISGWQSTTSKRSSPSPTRKTSGNSPKSSQRPSPMTRSTATYFSAGSLVQTIPRTSNLTFESTSGCRISRGT